MYAREARSCKDHDRYQIELNTFHICIYLYMYIMHIHSCLMPFKIDYVYIIPTDRQIYIQTSMNCVYIWNFSFRVDYRQRPSLSYSTRKHFRSMIYTLQCISLLQNNPGRYIQNTIHYKDTYFV